MITLGWILLTGSWIFSVVIYVMFFCNKVTEKYSRISLILAVATPVLGYYTSLKCWNVSLLYLGAWHWVFSAASIVIAIVPFAILYYDSLDFDVDILFSIIIVCLMIVLFSTDSHISEVNEALAVNNTVIEQVYDIETQ